MSISFAAISERDCCRCRSSPWPRCRARIARLHGARLRRRPQARFGPSVKRCFVPVRYAPFSPSQGIHKRNLGIASTTTRHDPRLPPPKVRLENTLPLIRDTALTPVGPTCELVAALWPRGLVTSNTRLKNTVHYPPLPSFEQ
jgi:hypothetical protein